MANARIILAMCCRQLHQPDDARSELAKAADMIQSQAINDNDPGDSTQGFWYDWVSARVLLREAEQKIN